jgi:hypothetical protein
MRSIIALPPPDLRSGSESPCATCARARSANSRSSGATADEVDERPLVLRGPLQSFDLPDDRCESREAAPLGRGPAFARDAERRRDPSGDLGERDSAPGRALPRDQDGGACRQVVEPALLEDLSRSHN